MTLSRRILVALLAASAVLAGCGNDDDGDGAGETQPAQDPRAVVTGGGIEIPVHPLADPLGPVSTKDGVTARSYELRNTTATQLFEWYSDRLSGWMLVSEPAATGNSPAASTRAIWTRGDRRLVVTMSPAPTVEGDDPRAQYSISVEPRG